MPIKRCTKDGKSGFKYGDSGHCYTGKGARAKAVKQAQAIKAGQARVGKAQNMENIELLVANISGKTRAEIVDGVEYIVAPVTMIVPGVLNGNRGPLLYEIDDIRDTVEAWNGVPLLYEHPLHSSGATEEDVEKQGLGVVKNASVNGKLTAEAWFNKNRTQSVKPEVLAKLSKNEPFELSTGLGTSVEVKNGEHEGKEYKGIARNYKPDHLAVFLEGTGACSRKDGCGVLVNKETEDPELDREMQALSVFTWFTHNEQSHEDMRDSLAQQVRTRYNEDDPWAVNAYVVDVFEDYVVYDHDGKLWQLPFTSNDNSVTLTDNDPVEVRLVRSYEVVANVGSTEPKESKGMTKEELVANIIEKSTVYEECDKEILLQFNDDRLQKIVENLEKPKAKADDDCDDCDDDEPVQNQTPTEPKKLTAEEWFDAAPSEVQEMARNYKAVDEETRSKLIDRLVSNISDEETRKTRIESLQNRKTDDLKEMVSFLPPENDNPFRERANYLGTETHLQNTPKAEKPEPLGLPVWNFELEEAAK